MSGYTTLAKNIGVLTIANFGTKLLSFFLVPLYTSILSTADYGTYDLVINCVGVLIPVLTQNIADAVLRFSIDKDADSNGVFGIGIKFFLISLAIVGGALIVNALVGAFPDISNLSLFVVLVFATQALSQIVLYYARGLNRFRDVAISSVFCSVVVIVANILFLIAFQWGLAGYFLANAIGPIIQILYLAIRIGFKHVDVFHVDSALEHDMVDYSRPMIANSIAWWGINVADRFIVTFFCGIAANGVYSIASKIPSILSVFQTIVGQAWTVSAVDEFDSEDKSGFFSNVYSLYNCLMVMVCSIIIVADIPLAYLLYARDFFEAWRFVPFLTISIVFGALAGYVGGILAAVKDSKVFARTTVIGAVVNIGLNVVTVPFIGPLGSAIATAICYWLTWFLRMRIIKRYIKLKLTPARDNASYCVLVAQSVILLLLNDCQMTMFTVEAACVLVLVILYRKEISRVFAKGYKRLRG